MGVTPPLPALPSQRRPSTPSCLLSCAIPLHTPSPAVRGWVATAAKGRAATMCGAVQGGPQRRAARRQQDVPHGARSGGSDAPQPETPTLLTGSAPPHSEAAPVTVLSSTRIHKQLHGSTRRKGEVNDNADLGSLHSGGPNGWSSIIEDSR